LFDSSNDLFAIYQLIDGVVMKELAGCHFEKAEPKIFLDKSIEHHTTSTTQTKTSILNAFHSTKENEFSEFIMAKKSIPL